MYETNKIIDTPKQVDALLNQLHHLLDVQHAAAGEQELDHELEWLAEWIEHLVNNNADVEETLDDHAMMMLRTIHSKLAEATMEEQRMQTEIVNTSDAEGKNMATAGALSTTRKEVGTLLQNLRSAPFMRKNKS
ncbi:MAG: hypothetical protein MK052_02060 [Alphaproteobacteria bacterium]|nr:hypothetical protein [Alphaproteobacteria bacterium]